MIKLKSRLEFGKLLKHHNIKGFGVELGVAKGAYSDYLLNNSNLKILFSIDKWTDYSVGHPEHNPNLEHTYEEYLSAKELLSKHNERSIVLKLSFDEALILFDDGCFDFIYIDGYAHTGQENGKTLEDWWPKLKPNGIFAGHDYYEKCPKTIYEVDKFIEKHNLQLHLTEEQEYNTWYCFKPEEKI